MKKLIKRGTKVLRKEGIMPFLTKTLNYISPKVGMKPYFYNYIIGYPLMKYRVRSLPRQKNKIRQLEQSDEWLLIILDACRYDRFEKYFDTYFEGEIKPIQSEGYNTFQYVQHTWPDFHEITYITGAAPINATKFDFNNDLELKGIADKNKRLAKRYSGYRPVDHIENIVEVWRTDWDEDLGVCPPEPVTSTAIRHAKDKPQMVVHYFQPHIPYIGEKRKLSDVQNVDERLQGGAIGMGIWKSAQKGNLSHEQLLELYDSNLKRVLNSVCEFILNTNYKNIVIMGDHGENLGEYGMYGHKVSNTYTRIVPWAVIESVRKRPDIDNKKDPTGQTIQTDDQATVEDRLESLGYI